MSAYGNLPLRRCLFSCIIFEEKLVTVQPWQLGLAVTKIVEGLYFLKERRSKDVSEKRYP